MIPFKLAWQMEVVESALNQNLIRIVLAKKNPNLSIKIQFLEILTHGLKGSGVSRKCRKDLPTLYHTLSLNYAAGSVRRIHMFISLCIPLHPPKPMAMGEKHGKTLVIPLYRFERPISNKSECSPPTMYETLRRYLFLALAQKLVLLPSWNEIYIEFIRSSASLWRLKSSLNSSIWPSRQQRRRLTEKN